MAASSLTLQAEAMATKKITFMVRWVSKKVARGSKGGLMSAERTKLRFH